MIQPGVQARLDQPPLIIKKKKSYHTGSLAAKDKKHHVTVDGSLSVSKNQLDSTPNNDDCLLLGSRLKIMSLNIEGIYMMKINMLQNFSRHRRLTQHSSKRPT
ncbi:hypothetical protein ElyMa_006380700 [Elysia marginata]|uniref:Uncharacterized protein n=1 Tax=Elysia marginata TaxID=1093978 RepID=A0AAV4HP81_9GAST|nr:hypothetical protein ElyMa_006380700 [Elysia marginata]